MKNEIQGKTWIQKQKGDRILNILIITIHVRRIKSPMNNRDPLIFFKASHVSLTRDTT